MVGGAAKLFVVLVVLFLYLPVFVTVAFSFSTSPRLSLPVEGLTLDWYRAALDNPQMAAALRNSLILAVGTSLLSGLIGCACSFGILAQKSGRLRQVLLSFSLLPAVVPLLVTGIALAVMFHALGLPQGLRNAMLGHVLVCLPFVVMTMNARLQNFDFSVLEAARDLGAGRWRAFRDITLPLIRPSLVGACLLAAALSLDEFVVTWFNIGNQQTVPVLIWGLMRRGVDPSINAVATALFALLVTLVVSSNLVGRRGAR